MIKRFWPWLLKTGWQILNAVALFAIYAVNKGQIGVELIAGLWLFTLAAMYGWKWFSKPK